MIQFNLKIALAGRPVQDAQHDSMHCRTIWTKSRRRVGSHAHFWRHTVRTTANVEGHATHDIPRNHASWRRGIHSEIMWGVVSEVQERVKASPTEWWLATDVADLYVKYRNLAKLKRAEAAILAPLGLTRDTFIANQNQLSDNIVEQITRDLINYELPYVSALVVGVDALGPHIYVIENGNISCNDVIGFAAIGIGARHAESQFMLRTHSWNSPLADTALLTYAAKKSSEVAPGVGEATDMFTAGPTLGAFTILENHVVQKLDRIYQKMKRREERNQAYALKEVNNYVSQLQAERANQ